MASITVEIGEELSALLQKLGQPDFRFTEDEWLVEVRL
jgi:hypothetical protein